LSEVRVERRLAAILAADVVGYSRLMGADEEGTLARLRNLRREMIDPEVAAHGGRIVKTTGDGILVEFPSVVEAVACAIEVQQTIAGRNAAITPEQRIEFRIGINLGDVIVEDGDIHGDGVNVAARLETLADPGGICVSRVVRDQVRDRLNVALDDVGEQSLKNIARPVRVFRINIGPRTSGSAAGDMPALQAVLAPPDKPSIAVLPFHNMSGDPDQEYFADGMVEEIITALSRIRWLFVIARNSTFTYKGQSIDVKRVGRELDVRYVLEGSVRKAGGRVRIAAQLIEAQTGTHLWADRFDGSLDDIFDLQDNVATSVAGVIEPTLQAADPGRSANRPTADLTAYDLYLQALPHCFSFEKERITWSLGLIERAIERDPRYGPALALAAFCHVHMEVNGWADDSETNARIGIDLAQRALQVASDDPYVLGHVAFVFAHLGQDIDVSVSLVDHALTLNPNFALAWYWSGIIRNWSGQPDIALDHLQTFLRLSPRDRLPVYMTSVGVALFLQRRFEEAAVRLLESLQRVPNFALTYRFLASCYAHMGRFGEAREIVRRLRAITPVVVEGATRYGDPDHRELFLSGLRLAAGEVS
jgi:adenylate cyclase